MAQVETRRIRADEGLQLRELRLRALADAPYAFAETLAEARARPQSYWHERAQQTAGGESQATFIAVEQDRWLGMAASLFRQDSPITANLLAMWADPSVRRQGVGQALVDAVVAWAAEHGATAVQLWVTEINVAARALYERMQFVATGQTQPLPSNAVLTELRMRREL